MHVRVGVILRSIGLDHMNPFLALLVIEVTNRWGVVIISMAHTRLCNDLPREAQYKDQ